MVPMMVEILLELNTGETEEELTALVRDFVDRLTGKQTIYQMLRLCEEIRKRGGTPQRPAGIQARISRTALESHPRQS
jgi:hypothetical protein